MLKKAKYDKTKLLKIRKKRLIKELIKNSKHKYRFKEISKLLKLYLKKMKLIEKNKAKNSKLIKIDMAADFIIKEKVNFKGLRLREIPAEYDYQFEYDKKDKLFGLDIRIYDKKVIPTFLKFTNEEQFFDEDAFSIEEAIINYSFEAIEKETIRIKR